MPLKMILGKDRAIAKLKKKRSGSVSITAVELSGQQFWQIELIEVNTKHEMKSGPKKRNEGSIDSILGGFVIHVYSEAQKFNSRRRR